MPSIWFSEYTLDDIQQFKVDTMVDHIGILFTEIGNDYLKGTMPVDTRTVQTMGILHGGASVVLAETLGSIAANLSVDPAKFACVGLDINANHIRSAKGGIVTGTAKPIHRGGSTQVWSIEIVDENNRLVCISRLTMAVLKLEKENMANPFTRVKNK
jgi:1,4-dihydroxy-2-naphthoyl-CoA hydrolase